MTKKKKSLVGGILDVTVATVIAGPTIGIINASPIPGPLKQGTGSLIGVGLVKGTTKLVD